MMKVRDDINKMDDFDILVVEDDVALAELIQRKLRRAGYKVLVTLNGEDALKKLDEQKIDLIFLDYKLPDMNAIEIIKILKDKNLKIPFVLVTGDGDERTAVEIMKLGAKDYIIKDTNLLEFLPAVVKRIKEELKTHEKLSQTESALLESEHRYKLLVENISLGILLIDKDNQIVMANGAFCSILDKSREDIIGRKIYDIMPFSCEYKKIESIFQGLNSGATDYHEEDLVLSEDKVLKVRIRSFPFYDSNNSLTGYIEVFEDITEQSLLEEQLRHAQKMEAIGVMAGGIAHDFNNLLTAMQGHVDLALLGLGDDSRVKEDILGIRRSVKLASNLTRQLLLFSRKQPLKLEVLNINENISDTMTMLTRILKKNIVLHTDLFEPLFKIKGDSGNIEQVIVNLVLNAQDAMPDGGHLTINTKNHFFSESEINKKFKNVKPGKFVSISITDTGTGIDEKLINRIFEPFFTTKGVGKGTGLGLAVVYGIVNKHNGWIDVKSKPSEGTSFYVYFPVVDLF